MSRRSWNSTRLLRKVLRKYGNRCHFCKTEVVQIASIPAKRRLKQTHTTITFLNKQSKTITKAIATVEHIQRIADQGTNEMSNLRVACVRCNAKRAETYNREGEIDGE